MDLHNAESAEIVDQILKDHGISNVQYRFYDNDGGYSYTDNQIDYDRARRETKGGKNCKLGVVIGGKLERMVPFPLSPVEPQTQPHTNGNGNGGGDVGFLKDMVLKLLERVNTPPASPPTPTLADMTAALANLDTLRGKQESAMEMFIKGLEFNIGGGGSTDWKTELFKTAREVLPSVSEAIVGLRGGGPPMASTPTPQPQNGGQLPPDQIIRAGIAYLKKKAIAGVHPDLIIEWVVNNAEEYQDFLRVVLNAEFSDIAKFDPEIGAEPYVSWFKSLFDGLRREFAGPHPVDDNPGGNVGDDNDTGNDGESSKGGGKGPKN